MVLLFLQNIFTAAGIQALFATLVHSLWLGAIMALLAGIIIMLTKRSGPQLRYRLLTSLLILFITGVIYLFFNAVSNETIAGNAGDDLLNAAGNTATEQIPHSKQQQGSADLIVSFFETYSTSVVWVWFLVMLFKCIQLITGLRGLYLLKRKNIFEVSPYWNKRMYRLALKIGITKQVVLLQSSLAKVPMVTGHLKPVILVPIGILNALPQSEIEAILLHELAHIRRNDFLINLLQQFAEIFFFFNPAVLWVSALIRNERENCCDDIAIAVTHDKKQFIQALVAFQEYNMGLTYATTFPGTKNHLLNRVKRIITNNNKTLNNMEKLLLVSGIAITCLAAFAFSPRQTVDKKEAAKTSFEIVTPVTETANTPAEETIWQNAEDEIQSKDLPGSDTIPKTETTKDSFNINYSGVIDGKDFKLIEENGRIKELYADGKKIPEDQYDQYKPAIDKIHQQMKENEKQLKVNKALLEDKKQEMQEHAAIMKKHAEEMKLQSKLMQEDFKKQQLEMQQNKLEIQKQMEIMKKNEAEMKLQSQKMQKDLIKQKEKFKLQEAEFQKKVLEFKMQQQKMLKDSLKKSVIYTKPVITVAPAVAVNSTISAKSAISVKPTIATTSTMNVRSAIAVSPAITVKPAIIVTKSSISEDIIEDLEAANIITDRNNLSFRLTNDELIVNGIRQPDAIHQKLLKKYLKNPNGTITFSYSSSISNTK